MTTWCRVNLPRKSLKVRLTRVQYDFDVSVPKIGTRRFSNMLISVEYFTTVKIYRHGHQPLKGVTVDFANHQMSVFSCFWWFPIIKSSKKVKNRKTGIFENCRFFTGHENWYHFRNLRYRKPQKTLFRHFGNLYTVNVRLESTVKCWLDIITIKVYSNHDRNR